jgi:hypothetical protein
MRSRTLFFIFNLFINSLLCAQGALISDPLPIRNDYGYDLIGRLRDRVLLFRDRYDNFEVQAFDGQIRIFPGANNWKISTTEAFRYCR